MRLVVERRSLVSDGRTLDQPEICETLEFAFDGNRRFLRSVRRPTGDVLVSTAVGEQKTLAAKEAIALGHVKDFVEETRAFDGTHFFSIRGQGVAELHSFISVKKSQGSNFDVFYLRCIGWFIADPTAPHDFETLRSQFALPAILEGDSSFSVNSDTVNGLHCVRLQAEVLEDIRPVRKTIWVSPAHAYMLVRRDYTHSDGTRISQINAHEPVEISAGLWIPRRCTYHNKYGATFGTDAAAKVDELRLREWQVGLTDASLFQPTVPAQAMIVDHSATSSIGDEPIIRFPSAGAQKLDQVVNQYQRTRRNWLLWANVLVVTVIVSIATLRNRIRRR